MSTAKNAAHRHHNARHGEQRIKPARKPMSDRSVYWGIAIVGFFVVMFGWLLSEGTFWKQTLLGYVALVLYNINFEGWMACRGRKQSDWKQAFARIPLRFAGFGTKDGRPVEAAHEQPEARKAMLIFGALSVLIFAGLAALLLWPG